MSDLARVASRQLGLVTREQALGAGLSPRSIDRRVESGAWVAIRRGVYRSAFAPISWHQRALASCLGRGAALALSHESAAYLHGLLPSPPEVLDLVVGLRSSVGGFGRAARVHRLREAEVVRVVVGGIPAIEPARTVVHLAARSDRRRGNELATLGWVVLRTTATQVRHHPSELLASLSSALC